MQRKGTTSILHVLLLIIYTIMLSFNYSGKTIICNTKLSSGRCINITNISLRRDWFFECLALALNTNIIEKISFRIDVVEKMAPWVLSSSNVSLKGTEIRVKLHFQFSIACYVEGRPKPKITWLKDGENIDEIIENNDEISLRDDNQILEFKFATKKYEGKYECNVENRVGHIQHFANVIIEDVALAPSDTKLVITIVSIIVLILSSLVIIFVIRNKKNKNKRNDMLQLELFFFREGNVGKQLGAGAFGRVLLAQVKGLNGKESPTRVALKMCKFEHDKAHLRALIMELKIMIHLGKHLNIVNLLGAHTSNIDKGELWILVEYCKYGNLLKFIQRARNKDAVYQFLVKPILVLSLFYGPYDTDSGKIKLQLRPYIGQPITVLYTASTRHHTPYKCKVSQRRINN
ncbi:Neuronal cell adhesion molecule [Armadillidium nasatum]|uniref:Neuronal cell adhesion molecule n=1 Tax=Armadillidium nasatum TaxID=96803 RepID=A0A5N5THG7_9CRUS|nr:Neuronal cell adhesion molecule [Armadillidium nasatum]